MEDEKKDEEHVFRSKLRDIEIPKNKTLHSYCLFSSSKHLQDRPCLVEASTGSVHTFAAVSLAVRRSAAALAGLGVRRGDVVMIVLRNRAEFVFVFLGASLAGSAATGANPASTAGEIGKHAAASGAKVVVTESEFEEKVKKGVHGIVVLIVDSKPFSDVLISGDLYAGSDTEIDPNEDVVALPFSSGTTGLPKGVMVTHHALVTSIAQQVEGENPNLYLNSDDVILCLLPLFHIYALNSVLLCGMRTGAAVVLVSTRFDLGAVLGLVEKYRVTIAPFVPPILSMLAKYEGVDRFDLSSLRMVITGGASLGKDVEMAVKQKLSRAVLGQGYGMTEAGSISMCLAFAKKPFPVKSGSCGTIIRNAEMKIVDPKTGLSLPRNEVGEICVRGDQIMKGFLNNPEATKETIDEQGWLHSGDLGYVDDDDELFIVDRLKELIKYKGFQVAPAELEALLFTHPDIEDSAVVPLADEVAGEVPVAFVVRSNGSNISEEDIKAYVSKHVVFYKRINRIFFIDKINRSPVGKIVRKELRAKLAAEVSQLIS